MQEIDPNLPINKTAALVASKSREQGVEFKCGDKITSMVPLPTTQFKGRRQDDLTGYKVGTFTVIGCALFRPRNHKTSTNSVRWVVRCKCGRYQMLTTKSVKKDHPDTSCVECYKTKKMSKNKVNEKFINITK